MIKLSKKHKKKIIKSVCCLIFLMDLAQFLISGIKNIWENILISNKSGINNLIAQMINVERNFIQKIGTSSKMTYSLNNLVNVSFLMVIQIELFVKQKVVRDHSMEIIF